jgi:Adenosine deaminase
VHLEGTVRAATLLQIARRNGVSLPADSVEGLARLYEFRDFSHFIEVWELTTCALRTADDFRQVVVDYAAEAASHGAVYLEGIFTPAEPVSQGARWEEVFDGYCGGAQEARELHGVQVRLTPEIARGYPLEVGLETVRYALGYRDHGVDGVGLGGSDVLYPAEPERSRGRILAAGLPCVLGYADFEAQNLRWHGREVWAVHDWDSLAWQPEAALAGAASGSSASAGPPTLAPIESSEVFLLAYQDIRGRMFTAVEQEIAWAASLWMAAYNAREEALRGHTRVCCDALRAQAAERLRRAGA